MGRSSLLVITGPPGAGKSVTARLVADRFPLSVLVTGDTFFAFVRQGAIKPWLPEADAQNATVVAAAASAAGRFAAGGFMTVFDGVVGPWFLDAFAATTQLDQLDYVVLLPTVEECVRRVLTREGHAFADEAATRKMHDEFRRAEIHGRHVIDDPPATPEAVADRIVAARDAGQLRHVVR